MITQILNWYSFEFIYKIWINHIEEYSTVIYFWLISIHWILQGVPKKMVVWKGFEFLTLGGGFYGLKKILRTFCLINLFGLFSKILSKLTLFYSKSAYFAYVFSFSNCKKFSRQSLLFIFTYMYLCKTIEFYDIQGH